MAAVMLLCSRNAQPQKALAWETERLGVPRVDG